MRQIGTVTDGRQVQRLIDYLLTQGIRVQVEPGDGDYSVWAIDEDHVARARDELQRFLQNPDDERYAAAEREARRTARRSDPKRKSPPEKRRRCRRHLVQSPRQDR